MPRLVRVLLALVLSAGMVALGASTPAAAHEERPAQFPDGTGKVPKFRGYDNPRTRVVCKAHTAKLVNAMRPGKAKKRNLRLLKKCEYRSIQTAINSIGKPHTSVYVLPGTYREQRWANAKRSEYCSHLGTESRAPLEGSEYIGSISSPDPGTLAGDASRSEAAQDSADGTTDPIALSYADQRACAHNLNLIAVFGDQTPGNSSVSCDSKFCGTQIIGTGRRMTDVVIDNRFRKLNALRLDRMGGAVVRNLTVQQAEFNAVYVMETDGFLLDRITARANDEYGILAFASDHGLIQRSNAYYNGDSGIYPGSGSDLNANNPSFEVTRYAIEIRKNRSHHNALGYSGTAGNSIWAHDNRFYENATGIATDSLFPGHPGLPQDHARWSRNRIYSNNNNYYTKYVDTGVCDKPIPERGYMTGTVCPVIPTPVGTGVLIAGGNFNSTDNNWIYDNWRYGTMQFWVPAPLRDEMDPSKLYDTSHHNRTTANHMGIKPNGEVAHNGLDHWWDDQGNGNCWEGNTYSRGQQTTNFTLPPPSCAAGGSVFTPGAPVKDAGFLSCSQYDRNDPELRHPEGCEWFDDPKQPTSRSTAADAVPTGAGEAEALVAVPSSPSPRCWLGWGWFGGAVLRRVVVAAGLVAALVVAGGVATARSVPELRAAGPTSVSGTEATAVFTVGDRTIRQVRYDDGGTLRYTFRLTNEGRLPVTVVGLSARQSDPRLFRYAGLLGAAGERQVELGPGDTGAVTLELEMGGCETLSARSGSFVTEVRVRTEQAGVFGDDLKLVLPEELHTGSPREAFCPSSTATSRPPG